MASDNAKTYDDLEDWRQQDSANRSFQTTTTAAGSVVVLSGGGGAVTASGSGAGLDDAADAAMQDWVNKNPTPKKT